MPAKKMTMGLIVGNRGFFPDHLARAGREEVIRVLEADGLDVVTLTPEESKHGAVETREEAKRCAELFKRNQDRIDGIIVTLPNFGEERAIAEAATKTDAWHDYGLEAVAPAGAVEARLSLSYGQASKAPGAVYIDAVEFSRIK